jgi:hypothetical protein
LIHAAALAGDRRNPAPAASVRTRIAMPNAPSGRLERRR